MDWESAGFVKASRHREEIVRLLGEVGPMTPNELRSRLSAHFSQVSQTLNELVDHGILTCLNPGRRRGRFYDLTQEGRSVYAFLISRG